MARYIDADKLVGTFLGFSMPDPNADTMIRQSTVIRTIHEMPTAEVKPVVLGNNISDSDNGFLCSVCSFGDFGGFHGYKPNYCPNCGAKMKEKA